VVQFDAENAEAVLFTRKRGGLLKEDTAGKDSGRRAEGLTVVSSV
jgi:hypothetical protein